MDAASFSLLTNPYLTYPTSFFPETICRLLPVASCKTLSFQHTNSSFRSNASERGGTPSSKKSFLGRASREDEFSTDTSSDSVSSNRERLIALFKRIQVEISQGESGSGNYTNGTESSVGDDSDVETSVLEFLRQSNRESKVESSKLKHNEEPYHKRKTTKKEKSIPISQTPSTNKFTRPRSNFVKKSPIPSQTTMQFNEIEVNNTVESSSEVDKESSKVKGMKLTELKELAKERGIRGYSKLKKNELIELLKS